MDKYASRTNAPRRETSRRGDLSHEVEVVARDEVGELAATFNLMIRNLAESQNKLEEWGKQLATKVAEQSGELNEAHEQVARVKKLASLEKMADGMAHIMAHISDHCISRDPKTKPVRPAASSFWTPMKKCWKFAAES